MGWWFLIVWFWIWFCDVGWVLGLWWFGFIVVVGGCWLYVFCIYTLLRCGWVGLGLELNLGFGFVCWVGGLWFGFVVVVVVVVWCEVGGLCVFWCGFGGLF